MNKFRLNLRAHFDEFSSVRDVSKLWMHRLNEIFGLRREFREISVESRVDEKFLEEDGKSLLKIASVHGSHVRKMQIIGFRLNSLWELRMILSSMPQLEDLDIWKPRTAKQLKSSTTDVVPVILKMLEKARVCCADPQVFKCFSAPKLIYLQLDGIFLDEIDPIINFLRSADNLESLYVCNWSPHWKEMLTIYNETGKSAFQLKKLNIGDSKISEKSATDLFKFLKLQEASLEDLEIGSVPQNIFSQIFSNLANLTVLRYAAKEISFDKEFYEKLAKNERLKELQLGIEQPNELEVHEILRKCPNIERLGLPNLQNIHNFLPYIAINHTILVKLSIKEINPKFVPSVDFPFLSHLEIDSFENVTKFIARNLSLEILTVKEFSESAKLKDLQGLLNHPNLKHLEFHGYFMVLKSVLDAFRKDYGQLETLKLSVINGKDFFFKFPEDGSQWKPSCDYFDTVFDPTPLRRHRQGNCCNDDNSPKLTRRFCC